MDPSIPRLPPMPSILRWRRFQGWRSPRQMMSFDSLSWMIFLLFWLLFWVIWTLVINYGIPTHTPTRGLDWALPDATVTVEDVLRLQAGVPVQRVDLWVNPKVHQIEVVEVHPDGRLVWNDVVLNTNECAPWLEEPDPNEDAWVFVRPIPGTTYGAVVSALDWLRCQRDICCHEVKSISLVRCEPDPENLVLRPKDPEEPWWEPLERDEPLEVWFPEVELVVDYPEAPTGMR